MLATQAWPSWSAGIRELFSADVTSYERIAAAAPGLPSSPLPAQHAERFPAYWAVGTIHHLTGGDLHTVYRVASMACLLAILLVMHRVLVDLGLDPGSYCLCLGVVAASAYPMRYLLAAPGMLSDAVFVLGLAVVALGVVRHTHGLVAGGVALAALGRQTAVPLALAAAIVLLLGRRPHAVRAAALTVSAGLGVFLAEWLVARSSSSSDGGGVTGFTVFGSLGHPVRLLTKDGLASADARAFLALLVPLGLIAGAWLRGRPPSLGPSLLAAAVIVQPLTLAPEWVGPNETRLAALALPALALVAADQLRGASLPARTTWISAVAILLASFHARYSDVGVPGSTVWGAFELAASLAIAIAVGRPGFRLRGAAEAPA